MAIDTISETLLTLPSATMCVPGKSTVSVATMQRWRKRGVRGVVLETILIGGSRYTSLQAISRFIDALNAGE